jgi:guanosine-3',5'-bis(diphosphate) 3'-pyrophosphohydrolase
MQLNISSVFHALAFAAHKHRDQRRKGVEASPYINHPIAVAEILAREGSVSDINILAAAILHDTVEDTECTFEELEAEFGIDVANLVREVTDDKTLPKLERKALQVERARSASSAAKQIKIADKVSNIRDITSSPPADWPLARRVEYLDWAAQVVAGCVGVNPALDSAFSEAITAARRKQVAGA